MHEGHTPDRVCLSVVRQKPATSHILIAINDNNVSNRAGVFTGFFSILGFVFSLPFPYFLCFFSFRALDLTG